MAVRETGKQRAARIPLDYFKHPDRLVRTKYQLTFLAIFAAVAFWAIGWLLGDRGRVQYSHGPVNVVHAAWETNCEACHVPFEPIRGDHWLRSGNVASSSDIRCESCHAGPPHHASQRPQDIVGCGACHREHQGRNASLVQLADAQCTGCHADLANHVTGSKTAFANVTRFAAPPDHPEFKVLRERSADPGKLKFNHALHMTAGVRLSKDAKAWTPADIVDAKVRDRYRAAGQRDGDAVQLQCASCHQLDGGTNELLAGLTAGAYYLPIRYEAHCRACHPLMFDTRLPDVAIPHRLQPNEVRKFLWGAYVARALPRSKDEKRPVRPLPGKDWPAEEEKVRQEIKGQVAGAENFLYQKEVADKERYLYSGKTTCGECHHYEMKAGADVPARIVPTAVPSIWFTHAKFNHRPHRALDCRACHARAFPDSPNASTKADDVLLPGIDNCVQCHAPPGQLRGGARFACTECHRYHNGDAPGHGLGAAPRDAKAKVDLQRFLRGAPGD
jgi:predicted CXXCH cytochrome family protein